MCPWVGSEYENSEMRLAIVCESHYLPNGVTRLNYDPEKWYSASQQDVPDTDVDGSGVTAHSYMNTKSCVEQRHKISAYRNISSVVRFEEIAFFNYIFRPAEKGVKGYSQKSQFDILDADREVSREIMEWFIAEHNPNKIVIASATVIRYACVKVVLSRYPKIGTCMTLHPRFSGEFSRDVRGFLAGSIGCCSRDKT